MSYPRISYEELLQHCPVKGVVDEAEEIALDLLDAHKIIADLKAEIAEMRAVISAVRAYEKDDHETSEQIHGYSITRGPLHSILGKYADEVAA